MFIKYQEEKQEWADLLWFRSPTGRRRKTRYRPLRFNNRTRPKGVVITTLNESALQY